MNSKSSVSTLLRYKNLIISKKHTLIGYAVVATTRQNGTCDMLTSAKLLVGYLVVGITRELDKEPSLHCYPIYISYKWSMLQQYVYLMSILQWLCKTVHPALMSMCPTCGSNVVYMLSDVIV